MSFSATVGFLDLRDGYFVIAGCDDCAHMSRVLKGIGYRLQAEAKQLGGLTVRDAITFLDGCDPGAAEALRAFGEPWLDRVVWVRGLGSRLTVAQEHPVRTVTHSVYPWRLEVQAEAGPPYVQITAD